MAALMSSVFGYIIYRSQFKIIVMLQLIYNLMSHLSIRIE